jgi:phospholipase/carboxylesterase
MASALAPAHSQGYSGDDQAMGWWKIVQPIDRRTVLHALIAAATAAAASGCTAGGLPGMSPLSWNTSWESARLTARPTAKSPPAVPTPGVHPLDLGPGPQVLVRIPAPSTDPVRPYPLVLTLHGAGGNPHHGLAPLLPFADTHQLLLLAPASRDSTWDVITQGGWGTDVHRINQALAQVFAGYPLDPVRLAISGFSDGASYALSLGLANADLFTHIIAFSPGFLIPAARVGTPQVYISHGRTDTVLPIEQTTRRIVPRLQAQNIPAEVHEFDAGHIVPADIAVDAVRWLTTP